MLPVQTSVVFMPVVATPSLSLNTPSLPSVPFDGGLSTYTDDYFDSIATHRLPPVEAASPLRLLNGRSDDLVESPIERSSPLKPAKRDRAADDEGRQILRCKRRLATPSRHDRGNQTGKSPMSTSESVERRNLRERRRIKLINVTFVTLRNRLPSYCWQQQQRHLHKHQQQQQQQQPRCRRQRDDSAGTSGGRGGSKRPSKVDTLRTAINYIRCLQDLLADDDRQRLPCAFHQTFDAAATSITVPDDYCTTSPSTVDTCVCSPATSASSSSLDELLSSAAAPTTTLTSTDADNIPEFSDRDVTDIFDWLI